MGRGRKPLEVCPGSVYPALVSSLLSLFGYSAIYSCFHDGQPYLEIKKNEISTVGRDL